MKITVIAGGGMGGTEKAAFLFASELSRRGYRVEALTDANGCRVDALLEAGVGIRDIRLDRASFESYLRDARPDVIHNHTSGYADNRPLYHALDSLSSQRPRLIETNVFGRLKDAYEGDRVAMRMFMSMASGCQAFLRPRLDRRDPSPDRHSVLYNPLPVEVEGQQPPKVSRASLGIPEDACVLVRVGRPGHKWANWECEAFLRASPSSPNLRLILMEPPEALKRDILAGRYGSGIHVLNATSDQNFLDSLYRLSDVMLHASSFGESYGYTLAEGMQERLPVITRTTPWADNAQVELVGHGSSGFVCGGVEGMARGIIMLANNPALRHAMGERSRQRIAGLSDLSGETDLLSEVINYVVSGERGPRMKERYESWMDFFHNHFATQEWDVLEKSNRSWSRYLLARGHAAYRQSRVAIASKYWTFRSRILGKDS